MEHKYLETEIMDDRQFQAAADDVAALMAALTAKWWKHSHVLATALADSLICLCALASKNPQNSLDEIAERIKNGDYAQIKLRYFGHKLGIAESIEEEKDEQSRDETRVSSGRYPGGVQEGTQG